MRSQKSKVKLNCNSPMIATGMVTIKAPRYGINTEKPTNTDKRATYSRPK